MDVDGQGLQGRDVDEPGGAGDQLAGVVGPVGGVDGHQEAGEGLSRSGGGGDEGPAPGTPPAAAKPSSWNSAAVFQSAAPSACTRVRALTRPSAIHCRICPRLMGPYCLPSAPMILYMAYPFSPCSWPACSAPRPSRSIGKRPARRGRAYLTYTFGAASSVDWLQRCCQNQLIERYIKPSAKLESNLADRTAIDEPQSLVQREARLVRRIDRSY